MPDAAALLPGRPSARKKNDPRQNAAADRGRHLAAQYFAFRRNPLRADEAAGADTGAEWY